MENPVNSDTGKNIAADFFRHAHTIRSYTAEVTRTYAGIENETDVFTISMKYPDKLRIEFQKSPKYGAGTIIIIRENQTFHYLPAANQVMEMAIDQQDWINGTSWADGDYWKMTDKIAGDSEIITKSCENKDGKTFCILEMRPRSPGEFAVKYNSIYAFSDALIWVDVSTSNPVKMQVFYDNDTNSESIDYRNITVNPDLNDSLFTIQFPPGVTIVTPPVHPPVVTYPESSTRNDPSSCDGWMGGDNMPMKKGITFSIFLSP